MYERIRVEDVPERFNVTEYFLDHAEDHRIALIDDGEPVFYGEIKAVTNQVGHALRHMGVRRGDRVLLALNDGVEFVASWFAAQKIGAVTAEIYSFLHPKDFRYYLDYVSPAVVVADASTVDKMREAGAKNLLVAGVAAEELRDDECAFDEMTADWPSELEAVATLSDEETIWKFTSGSSGAPKACPHPTRSPLLNYDWFARGVLDLGPNDVVLAVPKLFFGYARDMVALYPFRVGATGIIFNERTTVEKIFELVARHKPTILVNVPTMMSAMVAHPDAAKQDFSSLRACLSAGEGLPPDLHRRWNEVFGVEVIDCLGSAEGYHAYLSNQPGQIRSGSLGRLVPGYQATLVDDSGQPVPDGEIGRLELVGPTSAREYRGAPEKTAETFVAENTIRFGDLFERDAEGYFYYRGRADDLLKVRGVWVAPAEVENSLQAHPAVVSCAVVGYEDEGLTKLRAYVITSDPLEAEDLRDFAKANLSPHKRPHDFRFVDVIPKTPSGKLDRRALRGERKPHDV
ncbi:benzoate-CoA ligase family protein [Amycolatopsis lurida]|uniref:benzoate-CoA ligase family protein n=1 Tax=Amycolatopsis lurida TaxID=31959 RepID=UPI00366880EC